MRVRRSTENSPNISQLRSRITCQNEKNTLIAQLNVVGKLGGFVASRPDQMKHESENEAITLFVYRQLI